MHCEDTLVVAAFITQDDLTDRYNGMCSTCHFLCAPVCIFFFFFFFFFSLSLTHSLVGVSLKIGALKELPLNSRASALARACGHPESCVFYGDVFVGRVCTVPAPMRNGDFKLEDLNSSNTWIKTAASENFQCVHIYTLRKQHQAQEPFLACERILIVFSR